MKKTDAKNIDTRTVAENCSQFSPIASLSASTGDTHCSCQVCKKWNGKKCTIGLYDVVARSLKSASLQ